MARRVATPRSFSVAAAVAVCAVLALLAGCTVTPVIGPPTVVGTGVDPTQSLRQTNGLDIASDGTNSFVVWVDPRGGSTAGDVYGARISPNGTVLDPGGIPLGVGSGLQNNPVVSFDGHDFVVAWTNGGTTPTRVELARVAPNGTNLDPTPRLVGLGRVGAIASSLTVTLVAWTMPVSGTDRTYTNAVVSRIAADGTNLDPTPVVVAQGSPDTGDFAGDPSAQDVASNGTGFLVTYLQTRGIAAPLVYARVVGSTGGAGATISNGEWSDTSLASDGTNYLIAWRQCANDPIYFCEFPPSDFDIAAQLIRPDMSLSPAVTVATSRPAQIWPRAAYKDGKYLITYRRQDRTTGATHKWYGPVDIRATVLGSGPDLPKLAEGFVVAANVHGYSGVTAGPGAGFSVVSRGSPDTTGPVTAAKVTFG